MKYRIILALVFAAVGLITLGSCSINPVKLDGNQAQTFVNNITYIRDTKSGLCYGVIGTRMTGDTDQNGLSVTWVPCDKVENLLVNR